MKYFLSFMFYVCIALIFGSLCGHYMRNVDSELELFGISVLVALVFTSLFVLISYSAFPGLRFNKSICGFTMIIVSTLFTYIIKENNHLLRVMLFIGIPTSLFLFVAMILSVRYGVDQSAKQFALEGGDKKSNKPIKPESKETDQKKPYIKDSKGVTMLRGVDEIRKYAQHEFNEEQE